MANCEYYQAYLDDVTGEIPFPCDNCAAWIEKTDTCLVEEEQKKYDVVKALYPVKTTAKPGFDIHALVQKEFPDLYKHVYALHLLDWNDLDGVLDFLYGHRVLFGAKELTTLIDFIEARCEERCEVKK